MAEIASWNGNTFVVSPTLIRSFRDLTIKGSSETKNKTSSGQKYVSRKNSNPSEASIMVELNAQTGCDVQNDAMRFVNQARSGAKDYFYIAGKKLIPCKLMLTEASVNEVQIGPSGKWISCKVKLTMKQSSKYDSSSGSSSSSSSKKSSVKKKSTSKKSSSNKLDDGGKIGSILGALAAKPLPKPTFSGAFKKSVSVVNNARKTSAAKKKPTPSLKVWPKK